MLCHKAKTWRSASRTHKSRWKSYFYRFVAFEMRRKWYPHEKGYLNNFWMAAFDLVWLSLSLDSFLRAQKKYNWQALLTLAHFSTRLCLYYIATAGLKDERQDKPFSFKVPSLIESGFISINSFCFNKLSHLSIDAAIRLFDSTRLNHLMSKKAIGDPFYFICHFETVSTSISFRLLALVGSSN